ncbi:MAG: lipid asymmetry maintenance protein MlaB [Enterobacteriaceae bacterium]
MQQNRESTAALQWQRQEQRLLLKGELNRDTLSDFWAVRQQALQGIHELELSGLEYVDTYGLALLINIMLVENSAAAVKLRLSGISPRLRTLIQLYNLSFLIADDQQE